MKNHYQKISLLNGFNEKEQKWIKPSDEFGLLQQPVTYFFEEAQPYRASMRTIADMRLRQIRQMQPLTAPPLTTALSVEVWAAMAKSRPS